MPPPSLSPSRAADFKQCPLLYRFRVVDRLPQAPSEAAARGTVVHAVLERLFDLPADQRTLSAAHAMVPPAWADVLADSPDVATLFEGEQVPAQWLTDAEGLLARYFALEDPQQLEPAERELYVETELDDGLVLRGYVDRLDIGRDGDMRVVDYKTGRAPSEVFERKALFQMRFYALVLWKLRGVVPRRLQLMYLASNQVLTYDPDERDLRATEANLRALWKAIDRASTTGDWRPNRSRLCDWCDHQALCPEFGGTPPPLPEATVVADRVAAAAASLPALPGQDEDG